MTLYVVVSIVAFGNPMEVAECLDALSTSEYADFEVVVCENAGQPAYDELRRILPERLVGGQPVRVVTTGRNLGYAGGVNLCLRKARNADAWWVLNPDTLPTPQALGAMVARLSAGDCEAVGNSVHLRTHVVQSHGGIWRNALARAVSIGHGSATDAPVNAAVVEERQNYLNGASMLISRRFLSVVGPMREEYFLYCEEVEWCLRASKRGIRLGYAPGAIVLHAQGTSTGHHAALKHRSKLSVYLNERNRLLVTRDCTRGLLPIATIAALVILILRFGRRGAWLQLGYALEGWWAGVRNERGVPPA